MAREPDLRLIPLICPGCGSRLAVAEGSVIFPCADCGLIWEPGDGVLVRRELHVVAGEGTVHLPCWLFPFRLALGGATITTLSGFRRLTGALTPLEGAREGEHPLAVAPAAAGMPPHLVLRAGRLLTVRSPELTRTNGFPPRLMAIGIGERDALPMARTIVLATMSEERRRDLSFLRTVAVTFGEGRLCAFPFVERGERLLHAGWKLEI